MSRDEELAARIRGHLALRAGIAERRMFGGIAFMLDGHMAVAAGGQGGLLVRADSAEAERLVAEGPAERMVMNGRPMKAWLRVSAEDVTEDEALARWVAVGIGCAALLLPK